MKQDIQLYYVKSGRGEPLILLHGNGEDHTYFKGQIPALSERFTVYAVDTRGHGKSPRGRKPFTLNQFSVDLEAFLDERGVSRAHILGFSDGANIALLFALRCPERVRSLVLNSGNLDPSGLVPELTDELNERLADMEGKDTPYIRRERALIRLMTDEPHIAPEMLSSVTVPTLVIAGDHDLIYTEHTRLIYESLPYASLVILPGSHGVAEESPEAFNAALLSFYNEISD